MQKGQKQTRKKTRKNTATNEDRQGERMGLRSDKIYNTRHTADTLMLKNHIGSLGMIMSNVYFYRGKEMALNVALHFIAISG